MLFVRVGYLVGCLVGYLVGCLVGYLVGFLVGYLVGFLVGYLVGSLVGDAVDGNDTSDGETPAKVRITLITIIYIKIHDVLGQL